MNLIARYQATTQYVFLAAYTATYMMAVRLWTG